MSLRERIEAVKRVWNECRWCHGTRIFHPALPMVCPSCGGSGTNEKWTHAQLIEWRNEQERQAADTDTCNSSETV